MHFWIDKRSQACGFGRARVAASLSGAGLGIGHHHPRRLRGKSMVTPIHRFQNAECRAYGPRHHHHQQHNNHHQQHQHLTQNNHQQSLQHYTNNQQQQLQQQQIQQQQIQQQQIQQQQIQQQQQLLIQQQQQQQQQQQLQQLEQQQYQQNLYETHYQNQSHQQNLQTFQSNYQLQQHQQTQCQVPSSLSHQYGGPSHPIELEQGSMGISANLINTNQQIISGPPNPDAQLLPTHLKCGIWASLALATVFVAGAKFYFDHQGTGLEVLIFCAFSATFFLAACTVSLCRRPRDLNILPSIAHDQNIDNTVIQINHDMITTTISETAVTSTNTTSTTNSSLTTIAPPPPYHIAILLPETPKNPDETPPPSYDKILI